MVEPLGKDRSSINAHLEPTYKILYDQFMTHEGMYNTCTIYCNYSGYSMTFELPEEPWRVSER